MADGEDRVVRDRPLHTEAPTDPRELTRVDVDRREPGASVEEGEPVPHRSRRAEGWRFELYHLPVRTADVGVHVLATHDRRAVDNNLVRSEAGRSPPLERNVPRS